MSALKSMRLALATLTANNFAANFLFANALVANMLFANLLVAPTPSLARAAAQRVKPGTDLHCDIEFARLGVRGRLTQKTDLIIVFLHRKYATARANRRFMRLAESANEKSGIIFGDTELTNTGKLNTLTDDKSFVTSVTNKHKEITVSMLRGIESKHAADLELIVYSDFKSIRYAFIPKRGGKISPTLEKEINKDLGDGFVEANNQYVAFIKQSGFEVPGSGPVENWFRGGVGQTADQAGFAARISRDMSGPNVVRNFNDPAIMKALEVYHKEAEIRRLVLIKDPAMAKLLDGEFVKDDVLDLVKKSSSVQEAVMRIRAKYGAEISERQIERLSLYNDLIDNFNPGIFIADRKIASLQEAIFGGFTADFRGISAKNRGATARALAATTDLKEALKIARLNEKAVTKEFQNSIRGFNRIIKRFVDDTVSSGDDFRGIRAMAWTTETKGKMIEQLARLKNPGAQRVSFISENVKEESRNILAAHGEGIEKQLRIELEGKISSAQLEQVIFAVDMQGKDVGVGEVRLITGEGSRSNLNEMDRAEIETALRRAVRKFNEPKKKINEKGEEEIIDAAKSYKVK